MSGFYWRILFLLIVVVMMVIRVRYDLRQKKRHDVYRPRGSIVSAVGIIISLIVFVFFPAQLFGAEFFPMNLSPAHDTIIRSCGILIGIVAAWFYVWPRIERRDTWAVAGVSPEEIAGHFLCVSGPYKYVRHPMYSALIWGLAALELTVASWLLFITVPLFAYAWAMVVKREERELEAVYGDQYRAYIGKARWRFVPFVY